MIEIYTDGSTAKNGDENSPGSYGIVVVDDGEVVYQKAFYNAEGTTNNRMELMAMMEALNYIVDSVKDGEDVCIYSDSQYVVNCFNNSWKKKANQDVWRLIDGVGEIVKELVDLKVQWVKGHSGNVYNEMVDQLCTQAYPGAKEPKEKKQFVKIPLGEFERLYASEKLLSLLTNDNRLLQFLDELKTKYIAK